MKPSEVLLAVYNRYVSVPVHVRNESRRLCTKAELKRMQQCDLLDHTQWAYSLDGWIQRSCTGNPDNFELQATCHQYLWAAIGAWYRTSSELSISKGSMRDEAVQVFNDTAPSLKAIEEVLLNAYFYALSIEDPSTEFTTKEQVEWANKFIASMPPDPVWNRLPLPETIARWVQVMDKFEYYGNGSVRRYPEETEYTLVINEMKTFLPAKTA